MIAQTKIMYWDTCTMQLQTYIIFDHINEIKATYNAIGNHKKK